MNANVVAKENDPACTILPSNTGHVVPYRANGKRLAMSGWINDDVKRFELITCLSSRFKAMLEL